MKNDLRKNYLRKMIVEKSAGLIVFYLEKHKEKHKEKEPRFLLLKYPTYWGFVKGLIEKGESSEETALREAKEEANINKIKIIEGFKETLSYIFKLHGKFIRKYVVFYLGEIDEDEARKVKVSWEHQGFKWCSLDEALLLTKHKNDKEMLKKANNFIKSIL